MVYKERKRWVFLGLPFTFTKYTVSDEMITINSGLLNSKEDDCYMYKVLDVRLEPVSYTHLDVYKRQHLDFPTLMERACMNTMIPDRAAIRIGAR